MPDLVLEPRGPFSLPAAGRFLKDFPPADNQGPDERGTVRLAFVLDDYSGAAAVALRQADDDAPVEVAVAGTDRLDVVRGQLERILGLEHDAAPFLGVLDGDPVLRERWERTGHLRAVSFPSPYEAACWSVIALRLRQAQAVRVRQRIEERLGERIDVSGLPFLMPPKHYPLSRWFEAQLASMGVKPQNIVARPPYMEVVLQMVIAGKGVAVLFDEHAAEYVERGEMRLIRAMPVAAFRVMLLGRRALRPEMAPALRFLRRVACAPEHPTAARAGRTAI